MPVSWGLLDAEAQHSSYPDAFPIPGLAERQGIRPADMVKLVFVLDPPPPSGANAERMWVEVRSVTGDGYDGWLTNRPSVIEGLTPGTLVAFTARHVAGIALHREEVTFDVEARAVVSQRALGLKGPPGWAGHEEPLSELDSGWSVTAGDEPEDYFADADSTQAVTLGELIQRYPALVEAFQAGEGEWVYRPEHHRYVRLKGT